MAYQSLYRRYRPRRFAEIRGQDHVVRALTNAVREGRVGHAYLFSGPRGTGKTTTARVLAKVLNCANPVDGEPCCECDSCLAVEAGTSLDVLELDAASHNGVEDMRELVANAALGSPGRTKLYLLDEVHMLSKAASNALLKTLEEPPGHVVFVLATTDPQKVLPTIRSRTQHFEFQLFPADVLTDHVRWVAKDAGLEISEEAVAQAVRRGSGSARDALSALDQIAASGVVSDDQAPVAEVVEALCERDASRALVALARAMAAGRDPSDLADSLLDRLRNAFLALMAPDLVQLTDDDRAAVAAQAERLRAPAVVRALEVLGEAMVEMRQAPDARVPLEVAVIRLARPDADVTPAALAERLERLEHGLAARPAADAPTAPTPAAEVAPAPGPPPAPPAPRGKASEARAALGAHRGGAQAPPTPTTPAEEQQAEPTPPPRPAAAGDTPLPDRDALTLAWGDTILAGLSAATKARFGAGRFLEGEGTTAVFALPNAAHRDVCESRRGEVEKALAAHFGRPVPLRLVVDADTGDGGGRAAPATPGPSAGPEEEAVDVSALEDAPPGVASGVDRLSQAFPGAELVEEE